MVGTLTVLGIIFKCIIGMAVLCSMICGMCVWGKYAKLLTNSNTAGIPYTYFEDVNFDYEEFCNNYAIQSMQISSSFAQHQIPIDCIQVKSKEQIEEAKKELKKDTCELKNVRTVILVHGLGSNRYSVYPFAEFFLKKGFQVVTYDQRNTNDNLAQHTTYGYLEKKDLIDCAKYIRQSVTTELLGVWGSSLGGTTAALGVADPESKGIIDFMILDCPLCSMEWAINNGINRWKLKLPTKYLLWCGSLVNRVKMGFFYKQVNVVKVAKDIKIPSLILNSQADTITPVFMGQSIYDAIPGDEKWIYTVIDSEHTEIYQQYPVSYQNQILDLISSAYEYKLKENKIVQPGSTVNRDDTKVTVEENRNQWELQMFQ